jgi:putative transposase
MYSREQRLKAIELYIQYDMSAIKVRRKLGYPDRRQLYKWYEEYLNEKRSGIIEERKKRKPKYTEEQQQIAVDYYLNHGRNITGTIRSLGYPHKDLLRQWCYKNLPNIRMSVKHKSPFTRAFKEEAVVDFQMRKSSANTVADKHNICRKSLYDWRKDILQKETNRTMANDPLEPTIENRDLLMAQLTKLKEDIFRLQLEKDILEGTAELLKKEPGVNPKNLNNKEKTLLIDALREVYPLKLLLDTLTIPKSSYFYQKNQFKLPYKYALLKKDIQRIFEESGRVYGYRRIHAELKNENTKVSEKVVRKIMQECELIVIMTKKKKYSSYKGEISAASLNLINRNFHASKPNKKWLTDITEFAIPAGKVYLSPIVDCFDGLLVSWTIGTSPNADLANRMLEIATDKLARNERPIIHSDRGFHYRLPGWLSRIEKYKLKRSMSKKGYTPDNAACEGVFGRIKNEMFYNRTWYDVSLDEFMDILDNYLKWYNEKRIKISLGGKSPLKYREDLGLVS